MKQLTLPWAAWYGDIQKSFSVPDGWQIDYYDLPVTAPVSDGAIEQALQSMREQLNACHPQSVIIVVDDLSRPVSLQCLMPKVIRCLEEAGVKSNAILILIGLGSHAALTRENMIKKLGREIVDNYCCLNHNPSDTVPIGLTWGKTDVKLNRYYIQADFKIVISGLTPHSFAGFSGGAKMLFPGLADMETISKTHKAVLMGFMGRLGDVSNNSFRRLIEEFVHKVGLDYFIGLVIARDRMIKEIHCGNYIEAHRSAAEAARESYLVQFPDSFEPYDLIILNVYPKDTELLQAENGFIPLKSAQNALLKDSGIVILCSACSEGLGHHGLFGPGGLLYRKPKPLRFLENHPFAFYSDKIQKDDFSQVFDENYLFSNDWTGLLQAIEIQLPQAARVAVFPYASLQLAG